MSFQVPVLADWDVPEALMFYSRGRGEPAYRDLSNFAPSPIWLPARYDQTIVCCYADVETAFQAAKATDADAHQFIHAAQGPADAKRRGKNRSRITPPADWDQISPLWMLLCVSVKFQIPRYRTLLDSTADRILVEDAPADDRWGGYDRQTGTYTGRNLLGRALMLIRAVNRGDAAMPDLPFAAAPAQPQL